MSTQNTPIPSKLQPGCGSEPQVHLSIEKELVKSSFFNEDWTMHTDASDNCSTSPEADLETPQEFDCETMCISFARGYCHNGSMC
jgi:hypothetical protein